MVGSRSVANARSAVVILFASACVLCVATLGYGQTVDVYVSASSGDRLSQKPALAFSRVGDAVADFELDDTVMHQMILGFGASFLEAGSISLNSLPAGKQEEVLRSLFDAEKGAGLSAMKTVIGATDFSSAGPFYTYADTPDDDELEHFSIERDLGPHGLVTYIKRAQRHGNFILHATMDYPPEWMLTDAGASRSVDPESYDVLARYYLRYVQAYEKQGIRIDYLSPFNEPGVYTKIDGSAIRDLIKGHIGPLFTESHVKTKLQVNDSALRAWATRDVPAILDDPEARRYVSSISYHGYDFVFDEPPPDFEPENLMIALREDGPSLSSEADFPAPGYDFDEFRHVSELQERYPDLLLWMTEVCYFDMIEGLPDWQLRPLPRYDFEDGDFWGRQISADLQAGASGWTYWNMILDQNGGPPLVSPEHGSPDHNVQHPVVIINRESGEVTYTGLYYYLAHFSRFVRPGAYRVETRGAHDGMTLLGFKRPDGVIVAEIINSLDRNAEIALQWRDRMFKVDLPARSISTYLWSGADPDVLQ